MSAEAKKTTLVCIRCYELYPSGTDANYCTRCLRADITMNVLVWVDMKKVEAVLSEYKEEVYQQFIVRATYEKVVPNENGDGVTTTRHVTYYPLSREFTPKDIDFDNSLFLNDSRVRRYYELEPTGPILCRTTHNLLNLTVIRLSDMIKELI